MISDLTIANTVNTLQEYYDSVYSLQASAHGTEYMLVHDEISKILKGCDSYTELGVNQGATLAIAVLNGIKNIKAYDIALTPYNVAAKHFNIYADENNINLGVHEADTLTVALDDTDLLYIDTMHTYDHLSKELKLHGGAAKKYIIFHDTFAQSGLKQAVEEFVNKSAEWNIITDCQINVGFMTIQRN